MFLNVHISELLQVAKSLVELVSQEATAPMEHKGQL